MEAPESFRSRLLEALPRVRRYARTLAFDSQMADDLAQQTVERALLHWQQFDPQRDIAVWLLSIAHNAHLDGLRRDGRLSVVDPSDIERARDAAGGDPGVDVGLRLDLLAALRLLSPDQREALLLVCVEQLSYAEVAEVMRIPIGTVMSRVCRSRAVLRKFLEGERPAAPPALRRVV